MEKEEFLKGRLYAGLVHYPIKGKDGNITQTSITNLDVHDIARTSRTYDLGGYYLISPPPCQYELLNKILRHWSEGFGADYNKDRKDALSIVSIAESIEAAKESIKKQTGRDLKVIVTDAHSHPNNPRNISCNLLKSMLKSYDINFLLLFGTGWGLSDAVIERADFILEPVRALVNHNYNHLSVRGAAAIIIDRIIGESNFEWARNKH
ncbi:MAG: RNA methyltransferase [Candidatus Wallbacteria bacterium]